MSIFKAYNKVAEGPRELVFDAESTGILVSEGHRLVEVALVEMIGGRLTGREFHAVINPDRHIPEEVVKIHGIDDETVKDKPRFADIAKELRDFIGNDPVIITCRTKDGYTLDIEQLNTEFVRTGQPVVPESQWINVRRWSEAMFGDKNATLDKVLDRYSVNRKERDDNGHGAILDARLLSEVYPRLLKDYMKYKERQPAPAAQDKKSGPKA
jgi:DNA polymerase-3 subunit epsilon